MMPSPARTHLLLKREEEEEMRVNVEEDMNNKASSS
jgi:hypothetical protein